MALFLRIASPQRRRSSTGNRRPGRSRWRRLRTVVTIASLGAAGGGFASTAASAAVPAGPTGLNASVSGTSVTLTWTNASGALGVNVYRDTSTKFWAGGYPNPAPTTYTNTNVPAGTHTYAVADYNSSGQGPSSSTVTVTVGGTPPPAPTVSAVSPTSGPTAGGTAVTITGTNFTGVTAVDFGAGAASFTVSSATSISATSPAGSGTVDVTVTTGGGPSATGAADRFTYVTGPPPAPTVTFVNPVTGPAGTSVNVSGTNFTGASAVDFGANPGTFTVNSATTITATVPSGTGTVDVTVTTSGGTSVTSSSDQFTYGAGPPPGAIPSPVAGGWQLNGSAKLMSTATPPDLQLTAAVNNQAGSAFWPTAVPGVGISAAFDASLSGGSGGDGLTFTLADAGVTKPTALGVAGSGEGFSGIRGIAVSLDTFKRNSSYPSSNFVGIATGPGPTSDSLGYVTTNSSIPALRNTVHHFVVTTFSTGMSVTMDGNQVLSYATSFPSTVLVGFTAGTGQHTDVQAVRNVSITAGPPPPAPTVTGVSPSSGPSTGGTSVTISGTNLTGASAVNFGGMPASSFTVDGDTSITATTPAATGTVDVTVTTSGGISSINPSDEFTYNPPPPPTVTGISPPSGPSGTAVAVTGSGFTGATAVDFGSGSPATFTVTSDTSIEATSPSGTGTVDVTVTNPGGPSTTSTADQYTYTLPPAPTVTGVSPGSGFNGTSVTVTGTDFTGTTVVDFGSGTPASTFAVDSATTITATAPGGTGTVDITVTTSGGTSTTSTADQYTYLAGPPPPTLVATYRGGLDRTGYYPAETGLTAANAATLKLHWTDGNGLGSFAQPIVANNLVYWEDWHGLVHGTALTGKDTWTTNVGVTSITSGTCKGVIFGPSGTLTAADMGGTPVLFVPGGDDNFYALNALTGALIWKTSLGVEPAYFLWSSPTLYNGSVYEGVASVGDCPLVQGEMVQMDASTGTVQHVFDTVPTGCTGGGVWGSPTIDTSDGSIYFTTGNPGCSPPGLAPAIVKLRASDLSLMADWTVPTSAQAQGDSDFGSTPTLFTATINGQLRQLVGAVNKNGIFYAWDRTDLAAGPVWQSNVAKAGGPATGSIISAAWDGSKLYVGGGTTSVNGTSCTGSIDALNPVTGAFVWRTCQTNTTNPGAYAGITVVPGVLVEGTRSGAVLFLDTATGKTLFTYQASTAVKGEATVSNGIVYLPVGNGTIIALGQ